MGVGPPKFYRIFSLGIRGYYGQNWSPLALIITELEKWGAFHGGLGPPKIFGAIFLLGSREVKVKI